MLISVITGEDITHGITLGIVLTDGVGEDFTPVGTTRGIMTGTGDHPTAGVAAGATMEVITEATMEVITEVIMVATMVAIGDTITTITKIHLTEINMEGHQWLHAQAVLQADIVLPVHVRIYQREELYLHHVPTTEARLYVAAMRQDVVLH